MTRTKPIRAYMFYPDCPRDSARLKAATGNGGRTTKETGDAEIGPPTSALP
jgi:hypothetical protein